LIENCVLNIRKNLSEEEIYGNFRTIYFLAINYLPFNILEGDDSIYMMQDLNSATIHKSYRSRKQGTEILSYIGNSIQIKILDEIKKSPFFSLEIDESEDILGIPKLTFCVRYIKNFQISEKLLEITSLDAKNAQAIASVITNFLTINDL